MVAAAGFLGTGCSTYKSQSQTLDGYWLRGDLGSARAEAAKKAKAAIGSKDCVIWHLENGAVLRAARDLAASNQSFDVAAERIRRYDEGAALKLGSESLALLTHQANLPYQGRAYDKIMLCTYKALNYLEGDDREKARVEFNRARLQQAEAVAINRARIEKEEAALAKEAQGREAARKAQVDPQVKAKLDQTYSFLNEYKAESSYVNPAAVYLHGLFFMANAGGLADYEIAKHSFDQLEGMLAGHPCVRQDGRLLNSLMRGLPVPAMTYVFFETGSAPVRDQIRISLPLIMEGVHEVPYVGAAFPTLKFCGGQVPELRVTAGQITERTMAIASMDAIIARDFRNELPRTITKTMVSTLAKAAAAYAFNQSVDEKDKSARTGVAIVAAAYQAAVNIADTRTWTTLPKEIQICRVPTPADRKIVVATPDGAQRCEVIVSESPFNLISVRSINPATRLIVSQSRLQ
jgi:hypothetical protein